MNIMIQHAQLVSKRWAIMDYNQTCYKRNYKKRDGWDVNLIKKNGGLQKKKGVETDANTDVNPLSRADQKLDQEMTSSLFPE